MNIRHLRAFVAVVDCDGYARASAHLNLSQPALSRQIHALEQEFGLQLFHRSGRGVELSAEGRDLLQHTRELLAHVDAVGARARTLRAGQGGALRVGTTPNMIGVLLAEFLRGHQQRHPGVEVHLLETAGAHLLGTLARGDVHLAVLPSDDEGLPAQLLYPIHLMAVLGDSHRLSGLTSLEATDLAGEPLLRLHPDFAPNRWLEPVCQVAHIRPCTFFESAVPQAIIELARTGYGIAVVPSSVPISRDGVKVIPILHEGASIGRWATIAWTSQRPMASYAHRFVEELADAVRQAFPTEELLK
jgi:DNA-binding transcriptional LysR family regulator